LAPTDDLDTAAAEAEAVRILYRRELGLPEEAAVTVPSEDFYRLLSVVRARREAIEASALEMLHRATKEGRRYPRRHQRLALLILCALLLIAFAVAGLAGYRP
jgi:hypothetical protein